MTHVAIYHLQYLLFVLVDSFGVGIAGFPSIEDDVVDEGSVREFCEIYRLVNTHLDFSI